MIKKAIGMIFVFTVVLLTAAACRQGAPEEADTDARSDAVTETAAEPFAVPIREINKHGTIILDVTFADMQAAGIEAGDVVTVFAGDAAYDLPVGNSYTDVDSGEMLCRFDLEDNEVGLAINMGSFATETGIAEKQTIDADPGYKWEVKIPDLRLALKEKKGYLDEFNARNLTRTNDRADYPSLSDAEFANFRAVAAAGLKENTLYRSSSPLDPDLGRNEYAMKAMENAGIRTVLNLADPAETMRGYDAYPDSYYSRCAVVNPEMSYDFESGEFAEKVRDCVLFMLENDGPYLVHCKEGKDRTGIFCAVLECFAGASADDVTRDYMETYVNYFGILPRDTSYQILLMDNLIKNLTRLFGIETLTGEDLRAKAAQYLTAAGLTEEQLAALAAILVK